MNDKQQWALDAMHEGARPIVLALLREVPDLAVTVNDYGWTVRVANVALRRSVFVWHVDRGADPVEMEILAPGQVPAAVRYLRGDPGFW